MVAEGTWVLNRALAADANGPWVSVEDIELQAHE
jgi:hypothetical protein